MSVRVNLRGKRRLIRWFSWEYFNIYESRLAIYSLIEYAYIEDTGDNVRSHCLVSPVSTVCIYRIHTVT